MKKEMIAMRLAGGQGSRLHALTSHVAKPAVPFGGKYRIVDFTLSNCVNSGIDTVGVLTQYQPLKLNSYLGNGQPWDLDRSNGGLHVLPPYVQKGDVGTWFKGTANAIYQNINFIDEYNPEYVLILSGDHIYKMDYSLMLAHHKAQGAAATISVLEVTLEEARRFGIMNVDETDTIYEFEEKPAHPKSNLASMGIYIFDWAKLRRYLIEDEETPGSANDFGKNIIPAMLANGEKLSAYRFKGYWKDVGTVESLWAANMDMLDVTNPEGINVYDTEWQIFARNPIRPPHITGKTAVISDALLTDGCQIYGTVEHSVLFHSVVVEKGAVVRDSVLMPNTIVREGAVVDHAIVAENAVIGVAAQVGVPTETGEKGVTVIADGVELAPGVRIPYGTMCIESPKGGDEE